MGVRPEYQSKGVISLALEMMQKNMGKYVDYCETNLCLEDNYKIAQTWDYFKFDVIRRRRAWVKKLK